jgi:signal transduction histidine kinase
MTEGVNRLRAEFEDVVAHHVKTPLTSIKWSAEAALESTEPERSKRLGEIDALADRTLAYVKDLLRIARVATGGTKIKTAPTPLRATLNEVARDFRPELERTNQTLDMDIAASIYVMADQTLLKEVIYNLLSNAIKYGRGGGRITVTVEEVNGGEVETSFTDDGIGVPAKDRPELFRKFFRATNATGEGTGLGLAMVKEFTEAMGGSVSYKNRSDRGSTFVIRLRKA